MQKLAYAVGATLGVVFSAICLVGYVRGQATTDWPSTAGQVLSLDYEKKWTSLGKSRKAQYKARIVYRYSVDGEEFVSDSYEKHPLWGHDTQLSSSRYYLENVFKIRDKFGVGKTVRVYYDADDPSCSLLRKGYQGHLPTYLLFALVVSGGSLFKLARHDS